jgi:flagellar export protein FliJ
MTKARSTLATLLRVREFELTRAGAGYAQAARGLATVGAVARERAGRAAQGRASLVRRARAGEDAAVLRTAVAGVRLLGNASRDAQQQVEQARAATEQAHELLLEARSRVQSLERLGERLAKEERLLVEKAEQRELDEVGMRRGGRARDQS